MDSKRTWGGPRPNSGRPRKAEGARKVHKTFTLEPELAQVIEERAASEGVNNSEALSRCLREWATAKKGGTA